METKLFLTLNQKNKNQSGQLNPITTQPKKNYSDGESLLGNSNSRDIIGLEKQN